MSSPHTQTNVEIDGETIHLSIVQITKGCYVTCITAIEPAQADKPNP